MSGRMRRGFNRHRRTWYGVIGAVVIVGLILVVTGIGQAHIGKKSYTADFAQAGGIRPGDKVRVAGIDVGEVSDTSLQRDHVKVSRRSPSLRRIRPRCAGRSGRLRDLPDHHGGDRSRGRRARWPRGRCVRSHAVPAPAHAHGPRYRHRPCLSEHLGAPAH